MAPPAHLSLPERLLWRAGVVRRDRYTDRLARCEAAEIRLDSYDAALVSQRERIAELKAAHERDRDEWEELESMLREQLDLARAATPPPLAHAYPEEVAQAKDTLARAAGPHADLFAAIALLLEDERQCAFLRCGPDVPEAQLRHALGAADAHRDFLARLRAVTRPDRR